MNPAWLSPALLSPLRLTTQLSASYCPALSSMRRPWPDAVFSRRSDRQIQATAYRPLPRESQGRLVPSAPVLTEGSRTGTLRFENHTPPFKSRKRPCRPAPSRASFRHNRSPHSEAWKGPGQVQRSACWDQWQTREATTLHTCAGFRLLLHGPGTPRGHTGQADPEATTPGPLRGCCKPSCSHSHLGPRPRTRLCPTMITSAGHRAGHPKALGPRPDPLGRVSVTSSPRMGTRCVCAAWG